MIALALWLAMCPVEFRVQRPDPFAVQVVA